VPLIRYIQIEAYQASTSARGRPTSEQSQSALQTGLPQSYPDAHIRSVCLPCVFLPAVESLSRNQASNSGLNGKNAPAPGDVVLLIGNVPAGGEEVRTCLDLSLQSEPWPSRISCSHMELESILFCPILE
jgi:hypothetical protein